MYEHDVRFPSNFVILFDSLVNLCPSGSSVWFTSSEPATTGPHESYNAPVAPGEGTADVMFCGHRVQQARALLVFGE